MSSKTMNDLQNIKSRPHPSSYLSSSPLTRLQILPTFFLRRLNMFPIRPSTFQFPIFLIMIVASMASAHESANTGADLHNKASHDIHTHGFIIKAHGTILTLTFSFIFPLGVIFMRSGSKKAFFLHWVIQLCSMVASMIAMLFMIIKSWSYIVVRIHRLPIYGLDLMSRQSGKASIHHKLGLFLFCAIFLQAILGYYHHILYVKCGRRTWTSYAHIALGWLSMCIGWTNTLLSVNYTYSTRYILILTQRVPNGWYWPSFDSHLGGLAGIC
jgi:hypothetical protein